MDAFLDVALFIALLCLLAWIVNRNRNLWVCAEEQSSGKGADGTRMFTGTDPKEVHALYLAFLSRGYAMLPPTTLARLRRLGPKGQWVVNTACCVHRCKPYLLPYASSAAGRHSRIAIIYEDGGGCVPPHLSNWVFVPPKEEQPEESELPEPAF